MTFGTGAYYPGEVWDGVTSKSGVHGHTPTPQLWDQGVEEIQAVQEELNKTKATGFPSAQLWVDNDQSGTTALTATPNTVTNWSHAVTNDSTIFTVDDATGIITISSGQGGLFWIYTYLNMALSSSGVYHSRMYDDTTEIKGLHLERKVSNPTDVGNASAANLFVLSGGEALRLKGYLTSGSANLTMTGGSFIIMKLATGDL
jgi:hypothetical protein